MFIFPEYNELSTYEDYKHNFVTMTQAIVIFRNATDDSLGLAYTRRLISLNLGDVHKRISTKLLGMLIAEWHVANAEDNQGDMLW